MAHLRGPEGCPWDRAQTYSSMKGLLLEEAYEVVDAVDGRDFRALQDELGDLLFQVVFYSRLAEEEGRFTLDEVIHHLHAKLRRRHPHVFGENRARTPDEALQSWLAVKEQERESRPEPSREAPEQAGALERSAHHGPRTAGRDSPPRVQTGRPSSLLDGIPANLPSTLDAYELGVRAAEAGFDWAEAQDLLAKIEEEAAELKRELARSGPHPRVEEEVGDLLFAAANLARYLHSDPESCLRRANRKFRKRFQALEREVAKRGKKVRECSAEELDRVWNAVKASEAGADDRENSP